MMRFLKLVILVPLVVIALAFAIANRAVTIVSFDPFSPAATASPTIEAPLFVVLLLTLMLGVLIGSVATWLTQGRNRNNARRARNEAERLRAESDRLRGQLAAHGEGRAILPGI